VHTATTMESSLLVDGGERSNINEQPRWFTPTRLLTLFCLINMLNYLDRGVIASNGVNGAPGDPGCLEHEACFSGSGIQYVTLPILVSEHLFHMQGLGLKKP